MIAVVDSVLREIIKFSEKRGRTISYNTIIDLLKDSFSNINEETIWYALDILQKNNILIVSEKEENEDYEANVSDEAAFIPADINIVQRPFTISSLLDRLENNEIDLNPDFQRKGGLWTFEQQSQLIESLILKIPIPSFYFNATNENKWVVIDGLQRLTAFNNYLIGNEKRKFTGFQYLHDLDNISYDELPRQYIRRIKETSVIVFTIEKGTPDEVAFNIFKRINTGGLQLTPQEIRQALYQGKSTELIKELASCYEFQEATCHAISSDRMLDREYITRFIAFTELDYEKIYKGNIDNFLIRAMIYINNCDDNNISLIVKKFKKTMLFCKDLFGFLAFRKFDRSFHRGPINKAIFELWAICFSNLNDIQKNRILMKQADFIHDFWQLQQQDDFVSAIKSGDRYSVIKRIELGKILVEKYI